MDLDLVLVGRIQFRITNGKLFIIRQGELGIYLPAYNSRQNSYQTQIVFPGTC